MQESIGLALVGALIFGTAGICGALLATALLPRLKRLPDGPAPIAVHPGYLVAGAALLGAVLGWRRLPNPEFVIAALVTIPMVGAWYCDAMTGIVPDAFTLVPLVPLAVFELALTRQPFVIESAAVMFVVFAIFAWISKGRGVGWGDVKLATFGGALLGMKDATLAFGVASLAAVIVASIRYRSKPVPIVFAPYLIGAMAFAIAFVAR
ncbi:MAG TPA: prepilin peptidase [Candidatus Acidoferrales bacterium]|nr:prepilin peptidase [Candidatus Acidoferrales bacterium]